jgi:NitT/TauT family transport system ATP-binding protein
VIELQNITFGYPGNRPLFHDLDWSVKRGEQWAVLGPSGCGKSTLLMLMAGLRTPQRGRVVVDGKPLIHPTPATGLVFQDYELLPWASVRQNVELGLRIRRFYGNRWKHAHEPISANKVRDDADEWLKRLDIHTIADRLPAQISGGQRQRTAIARILATDADRLLMDEPFSALDAPTREGLQTLTGELCRENHMTLVLVTHAIEEAVFVGQKILVMRPTVPVTYRVIDNAHQPAPDFRADRSFRSQCQTVRETLE